MSAQLKSPLSRFRPLQQQDLREVLEIEERVYAYPWTQGIFSDCLRVGYSCWVLEMDSRVIGYGIVSIAAGEAHILNLCVSPDHQGQGYGQRLLNRLIDLGRLHEAGSVFLEVRPSNHRAIKMYEARGFKCVGRRPNYYPAAKGREDALIMVIRGS